MEANTEAIEPPFPLQFAGVVKPLAKELDHVWDTGCGNNEMELDNMADEN